MDTKVNYVVVGIFVVVLSAAIIITSAWLSGGHGAKTYRAYLTYLDETVAGLSEKAPVKFNGVDVGFVEEITLNPKNPQQVRLILEIDERTPINSSTVAFLQSQGITGYMFIALAATKPAAPPIEKPKDEPYPVIKSKASFLFQLDNAVQAISENISDVGASIKSVFDEENRDSLRNVLHNVDELTATLRKNSVEIDNLLQSANTTFKNTATASQSLPKLIESLNTTVADVKSMTKNLNTASQGAKVALQDISDQTLPSAHELIEKLNSIMSDIKVVSSELADNPSILVRGKVAAPSGPGE